MHLFAKLQLFFELCKTMLKNTDLNALPEVVYKNTPLSKDGAKVLFFLRNNV